MMLPHAVLCAMVATPAVPSSTGCDAPETPHVAPAPNTSQVVPARLVADMAAPSSDPVPWDYTFEPWPPCSFG